MRKYSLLLVAFGSILLLGFLHVVASWLYFYVYLGWFDNVMHFLGGLSIGLFIVWFYTRYILDHNIPLTRKRAIILSVISLIIIGVGWEVFEYVFGITESTERYPFDVMNDLIADILGSIAAGFIASLRFFHE